MTRDQLQRILLDGCDRILSMSRWFVSQEQRDVATACRVIYQNDYDTLDKILRLIPVSNPASSTVLDKPVEVMEEPVEVTIQQEMLARVNTFRRQNGVHALTIHPSLRLAARLHSQAMALAHVLDHNLGGTLADRLAEVHYRWQAAGENIAYNWGYPDPWPTMFEQWLNSPPHRANLLDPRWRDIGIGLVEVADGTHWGTLEFGQPQK